MADFLPCPFCGSDNLESGGDDKFVGVRCLSCDATGPNHYGKTEWNTRAPAQGSLDRNTILLAAKDGNLKFWRASAAQEAAFNAWKAGGFVGECPQRLNGTLVDYITDAVIGALALPSTDRSVPCAPEQT